MSNQPKTKVKAPKKAKAEAAEPKVNALTPKQERFCREFVLSMNQSDAYRKAYDTENMKPETINRSAHELTQNRKVAARIKELQADIEGTLGISKITMIETLKEIYKRSLQAVPVMKFDKFAKEEVQVIDSETGEGVWQYDSAGANSAVDKIMKAMGYYAAEKKEFSGPDGKPLPSNSNITVFSLDQLTDEQLEALKNAKDALNANAQNTQ